MMAVRIAVFGQRAQPRNGEAFQFSQVGNTRNGYGKRMLRSGTRMNSRRTNRCLLRAQQFPCFRRPRHKLASKREPIRFQFLPQASR